MTWGATSGTGLVSVEYTFQGESAHSAGAPWRGRSALDAVELMNVGWNFRREHLRLQQRSHYVIRNGGDQPNVVPQNASVWYYFRETQYQKIKELWETGDAIAQGAAMMTGTKLSGTRVLGAAWPQSLQQDDRRKHAGQHRPRRRAEVGRQRSGDGEGRAEGAEGRGEGAGRRRSRKLGEPVKDEDNRGGGSDDIGDISWVVPTVTLRYPSNIPGTPGHSWCGRDRDGDADRAQRRDRGREGAWR